MIEYTTVGTPQKRITILPEYVESLEENGSNAQQTILTMVSGKTHIVEVPYEKARIHVGQCIGGDLDDEEFEDESESDNDFLGSN